MSSTNIFQVLIMHVQCLPMAITRILWIQTKNTTTHIATNNIQKQQTHLRKYMQTPMWRHIGRISIKTCLWLGNIHQIYLHEHTWFKEPRPSQLNFNMKSVAALILLFVAYAAAVSTYVCFLVTNFYYRCFFYRRFCYFYFMVSMAFCF